MLTSQTIIPANDEALATATNEIQQTFHIDLDTFLHLVKLGSLQLQNSDVRDAIQRLVVASKNVRADKHGVRLLSIDEVNLADLINELPFWSAVATVRRILTENNVDEDTIIAYVLNRKGSPAFKERRLYTVTELDTPGEDGVQFEYKIIVDERVSSERPMRDAQELISTVPMPTGQPTVSRPVDPDDLDEDDDEDDDPRDTSRTVDEVEEDDQQVLYFRARDFLALDISWVDAVRDLIPAVTE